MAPKRKSYNKGGDVASTRKARTLLANVVKEDQIVKNLSSVIDPKTSFFECRPVATDLEETEVRQFRPLNIESQLIFEISTNDPALFIDLSTLNLSFEGQIKKVDPNTGKNVKIIAGTPDIKEFVEKVEIQHLEMPPKVGAKKDDMIKLKTWKEEVKHKRSVMTGELVVPGPWYAIFLIYKNTLYINFQFLVSLSAVSKTCSSQSEAKNCRTIQRACYLTR